MKNSRVRAIRIVDLRRRVRQEGEGGQGRAGTPTKNQQVPVRQGHVGLESRSDDRLHSGFGRRRGESKSNDGQSDQPQGFHKEGFAGCGSDERSRRTNRIASAYSGSVGETARNQGYRAEAPATARLIRELPAIGENRKFRRFGGDAGRRRKNRKSGGRRCSPVDAEFA